MSDVLVALLLVATVWVAVAVTMVMVGGADGAAERNRPVFLALAFVLEGSLLAAAVAIGPLRRRASLTLLGFRPPVSGAQFLLPFGVIALSLALTILYGLAVRALGLGGLEPPPLPPQLRQGGLDVPGFVLTVLWGPLAEETFFRGFVFPAFLGRMGLVWAAGSSSVLFAVSHGVLGLIIPAFLTGLLLAFLYAWTRSLWSVWVAHALQNGLIFTLGS